MQAPNPTFLLSNEKNSKRKSRSKSNSKEKNRTSVNKIKDHHHNNTNNEHSNFHNFNNMKSETNEFKTLYLQEKKKELEEGFREQIIQTNEEKEKKADFSPKLINEFFFRRSFLNYFKFKDYDLMNHFLDIEISSEHTNLDSEDFGDQGNPEYTQFFQPHPEKPYEEYIHTKMPFTIKNISSKRWLTICYNMLFMGLIQHHKTFGILLDEVDMYYLTSTAAKIQDKLLIKEFGPVFENPFTKNSNSNNNYNINRVSDSQKILFNRESIQKDPMYIENSKEENYESYKSSMILNLSENEIKNTGAFINDYDDDIHFQKNQNKNFSYTDVNNTYYNKTQLPYKNENNYIKIDDGYLIDADKYNKISLMKIKSNKPNIVHGQVVKKPVNYAEIQKLKESEKKHFDTNYCVSELYNICLNYLREKTKTIDLNASMVKKLGVCTIIRDYFNKNGISFGDLNSLVFYNVLKGLFKDEIISSFLYVFASKLGKKDVINVQHFLVKIEEVLLIYLTTI